jgi:hypothetical protein
MGDDINRNIFDQYQDGAFGAPFEHLEDGFNPTTPTKTSDNTSSIKHLPSTSSPRHTKSAPGTDSTSATVANSPRTGRNNALQAYPTSTLPQNEQNNRPNVSHDHNDLFNVLPKYPNPRPSHISNYPARPVPDYYCFAVPYAYGLVETASGGAK